MSDANHWGQLLLAWNSSVTDNALEPRATTSTRDFQKCHEIRRLGSSALLPGAIERDSVTQMRLRYGAATCITPHLVHKTCQQNESVLSPRFSCQTESNLIAEHLLGNGGYGNWIVSGLVLLFCLLPLSMLLSQALLLLISRA
jgi:hypothetical protein